MTKFLLSAALVGSLGAAMPTGEPQRFPQLTLDQLDPQARLLGEEITSFSSAGLQGPYNVMLRSPGMAEPLIRLMEYSRFHSALPLRLNEFVILIQARLWTSDVEWYSHYPLALKAGLPQAVADDLKANNHPQNMKPDEELVYDVCMEMASKKAISNDLFYRAKSTLGEKQLVDLIAVSGTFQTVAMMLSLNDGGWPPNTPVVKPFAKQ
jgi:4-carboxymuconolactone decarboxylase